MSNIKTYIKSHWERFWGLVDSDSIIVNQMLFYVLISLSGLYNIIVASVPIQVMEKATTPGYYQFWVWICLCAPLVTIIGKLCKKSWSYTGLWLQLAGDIVVWLIFVSYVAATFGTTEWDKGLFAGFLAIACFFGTPIFIARDIRKLRLVETVVKNGLP